MNSRIVYPGCIYSLTQRNPSIKFPPAIYSIISSNEKTKNISNTFDISDDDNYSPLHTIQHSDENEIEIASLGCLYEKQCNSKEKSAKETFFVNPKQFHRILRRREIRTQLRKRMIDENALETLYEVNGHIFRYKSRHVHASNRPRGKNGKFLPKKKEHHSN